MSEHVYVCDKSSGFRFAVIIEDEKGKETRLQIVFAEGQYRTDDDKIAAEIDKMIATKLPIRQRVRKTDKAAAEALVKQLRAQQEKTGAVKGGVTSVAVQQAMQGHMHQRDQELQAQSVHREDFADENLVLTQEDPAVINHLDELAKPVDDPPSRKLKLGS